MFITIKFDSNNKTLVTEKGNSRCSCRVRTEQPKGNIYSHFSVFKNTSFFIFHSFLSLQQSEVDTKPEKAEAAVGTCPIPPCTGAGRAMQVWHAGDSQPCTDLHSTPRPVPFELHLQKQLHFAKCPLRKSVELGSPTKMLRPCRIAGGEHYTEAKSFMGWGGWVQQEKSLLYAGENKTSWRMSMATLTKAAQRAQQSIPVAAIC